LASGVKAYGEQNAVQVMATVMSAVRAGMSVQAASDAAGALASSGYALHEMSRIMQHTRERVRQDAPGDRGAALALQVRLMAQKRTAVQAMVGALDGNGHGQGAGGGQGGSQGSGSGTGGSQGSGGQGSSGQGSGGQGSGNGSGGPGGSGSGKGGK